MPEIKQTFPFITRDMLNFEHATTFKLLIEAWADNVNPITIVGMSKSGTFNYKVIPSSSGVITRTFFTLGEIPIWISAVCNANVGQLAQTFIRISLAANDDAVLVLASGYVTNVSGVSWPNGSIKGPLEGTGRMRTITTADPAAGAEISTQVTSRFLWKIKAVRFLFAASGDPGTRTTHLVINNGADDIIDLIASSGIGANLSYEHTWIRTGSIPDTIDHNDMTSILFDDFILPANAVIKTMTTGIFAGDNYGPMKLYVEQFIMGALN